MVPCLVVLSANRDWNAVVVLIITRQRTAEGVSGSFQWRFWLLACCAMKISVVLLKMPISRQVADGQVCRTRELSLDFIITYKWWCHVINDRLDWTLCLILLIRFWSSGKLTCPSATCREIGIFNKTTDIFIAQHARSQYLHWNEPETPSAVRCLVIIRTTTAFQSLLADRTTRQGTIDWPRIQIQNIIFQMTFPDFMNLAVTNLNQNRHLIYNTKSRNYCVQTNKPGTSFPIRDHLSRFFLARISNYISLKLIFFITSTAF